MSDYTSNVRHPKSKKYSGNILTIVFTVHTAYLLGMNSEATPVLCFHMDRMTCHQKPQNIRERGG